MIEALELKACPFCGGHDLSFDNYDIDGWISHVTCRDCDDARGPMSEYKHDLTSEAEADAAAQWNTRADTAEDVHLEAEVARLREALLVYADACDATETTPCGYEGNMCCMTARRALKETQP